MTKLRFLGDLSLLGGFGLALLAGVLCFWLYRRETRRTGLAYGRILPGLRSLAVALIVLMLTGPTLQHRQREGQPGRLTIVVDDSASMTITDGRDDDRFSRAVNGLLNVDPDFLPKLAESFELKVVRGSDRNATELWTSTLEQVTALPDTSTAWQPTLFRPTTELGELLDHDQSTVMVLLSDGRINSGLSLVEAAQQLPYGQRPIFTVCYGQATAPADLAIVSIEHPDRLFRRDTLAGKLVLRDTMPAGQSFRIQAWHRDVLAWEQRLTTEGLDQRTIAFSFPIEQLVETASDSRRPSSALPSLEVAAIPMELQFRIVDCPGDTNATNNQRDMQFWGDLHRARVLMVDGRSRWETRYLKNVFERDSFWDLNSVIAEPAEILGGDSRLPIGEGPGYFPATRDELMQYDLVIIGELPADALSPDQQRWLVDFVVESGGGLIAIDGRRDAWSAPELNTLSALLPVIRIVSPASEVDELTPIHRTPAGRALAALDIDDGEDSDDNEDSTWRGLPPLHWLARTEVIPGSEVLAIHQKPDDGIAGDRPIFVTRLQGAGRVFYAACDETWRWRYKVADKIHQRLWNQIARWIMRTPYVVESEFVSLDAGRMTYLPGQEIEIRCRLKNDDSTPLSQADVEAIIHRDGQRALVLSLASDAEVPGVYRGTAANMPPGNYTVALSATGIPRQALAVQTQFVVAPGESVELNEQTSDMQAMRRVAELTGGKSLLEDELPSLIDQLKPLSQGRIIESETILWQSYYWFFPILACLSIEWWLRKRAGLI